MKLYWRYKKDGKWTWAPAHLPETAVQVAQLKFMMREMEEEE